MPVGGGKKRKNMANNRALPLERSCCFPDLDEFAGKKVAIKICDHYLGRGVVEPMERTSYDQKKGKVVKSEVDNED